VPTPANVVPKTVALQYDGTNSDQILEVIAPEALPAVVSEADGVLVVSPGPPPYGNLRVATGQYVIYQSSGGQMIPAEAVDTLGDYAVLS
jgi:hypothetical protein